MAELANNCEATSASTVVSPEELPSKSRSLRARSIQKRLETEAKKNEPKKRPPRQKNSTMSKYRRKTANAKERDRMRCVNDAFERLKNILPSTDDEQEEEMNKGTKVCTLRYAIQYINSLQKLIDDSNNGLVDSSFYEMEFPEDNLSSGSATSAKNSKKKKKDSQKKKRKKKDSKHNKSKKPKKSLSGVKKSTNRTHSNLKLKRLTTTTLPSSISSSACVNNKSGGIEATTQILYCNMLLQPLPQSALHGHRGNGSQPSFVLVQQHSTSPNASSATSPPILLRATSTDPPLVQLPPVPSPTFSVDSDTNSSHVSTVSPTTSSSDSGGSNNNIALKLASLEPVNWVMAAPSSSPTVEIVTTSPTPPSAAMAIANQHHAHPQPLHQDPAWCGILDDIEDVLKQDETFDILI